MPFPYTKQTWTDGVSAASAARFGVIEDGIALAGVFGTGSSPPGSPSDGMIWRLPADSANGVYWFFQYDSSQATYKWVGLGSARPMSSEVSTSETRNNAAYGDLTTVGPSVTVPRAGDYLVQFGCNIIAPASVVDVGQVAVKRGAAATADVDRVLFAVPSSASTQATSVARTIRMNGLAASDVLKLQYKNSAGGNTSFQYRWLNVTPVRVI